MKIQPKSYLTEINHALWCVEKCQVPARRVHKNMNVTYWSKNPNLVSAFVSAKLWLRIWNESDELRPGIANELRFMTKRKFTRALKDHKILLMKKNVGKIASDPSLSGKSFKRSDRTSVGCISRKKLDWLL